MAVALLGVAGHRHWPIAAHMAVVGMTSVVAILLVPDPHDGDRG